MIRPAWILATALLVTVLGAAARAGPMLTLNTANEPPNSTAGDTGIGDRVVREAGRRIGCDIKILHLPSERALLNANEGIDDGNYARVEGLEQDYPRLVMVPEPVTRFEFSVFARGAAFTPAGWGSLAPYHVGIVKGWKILEKNIADVKSLTVLKDKEGLFTLLEEGRVDVVVYDRRQGESALREMGLSDIAVLEPPLAEKDMFLYLNARHRELAPRFAEAIRQMKGDGTYDRILREALAPPGRRSP